MWCFSQLLGLLLLILLLTVNVSIQTRTLVRKSVACNIRQIFVGRKFAFTTVFSKHVSRKTPGHLPSAWHMLSAVLQQCLLNGKAGTDVFLQHTLTSGNKCIIPLPQCIRMANWKVSCRTHQDINDYNDILMHQSFLFMTLFPIIGAVYDEIQNLSVRLCSVISDARRLHIHMQGGEAEASGSSELHARATQSHV